MSEFPSFQKAEQKKESPRNFWNFVLIGGGLLLVFALIFLSFRFLVGAKTPRDEILVRILSASDNRQSSLLLEWLQNIDQDPDWKPNMGEQMELLKLANTRKIDLARETKSPALYALHVASFGPGLSHNQDVLEISISPMTSESRLGVALYYLRQELFDEGGILYMESAAQGDGALRKVAAAYFARCVASGKNNKYCKEQLPKLLGDPDDEVKWNAALAVLRDPTKKPQFSEAEIIAASGEMGKLYSLIKSGDPTVLSRFQGAALESIAREVFQVRMLTHPEETRVELKQISDNHPDLRVRNVARAILEEK